MSVDSPELIGSDILLPIQWYTGMQRKDPRFHGAKQLMLAVLVDALQCFRTGARSRTAIQRRSLAEAEAWIADRKGTGPFAFETICEALGINPDLIRESVTKWREQRLGGNIARLSIRHFPATRFGAITSPVRRRRKGRPPIRFAPLEN
jgi:hypothetical protein